LEGEENWEQISGGNFVWRVDTVGRSTQEGETGGKGKNESYTKVIPKKKREHRKVQAGPGGTVGMEPESREKGVH